MPEPVAAVAPPPAAPTNGGAGIEYWSGNLADNQLRDEVESFVVLGIGGSSLGAMTSQLAADRTLLPSLRQQLSAARHALTVLVGKTPAGWAPRRTRYRSYRPRRS